MRNNMEWITEVTLEKRKILSTETNPIKILFDVFDLCQNDFDVNYMSERYPEYYRILKELCCKEYETEEELFANSGELVKFFQKNEEEVKEADIHLYYAVLNFCYMLRRKNVYWDLLYT